MIDKKAARQRRAAKTRVRIARQEVVRLTVHRTNQHIYAQVVDAAGEKVLASASTLEKEVRAVQPKGSNKEAAALVAEVRSADEETLGVANTLHWSGGKLHAHNTDWLGAVRALDESVPDWTRTTRRAVVIGGGGAARAIAYGLVRDGERSH